MIYYFLFVIVHFFLNFYINFFDCLFLSLVTKFFNNMTLMISLLQFQSNMVCTNIYKSQFDDKFQSLTAALDQNSQEKTAFQTSLASI